MGRFRSLVSVVLLFWMFSCTEKPDEYTENPVLGRWNHYHPGTDSLVMTRVFTRDYKSYFSYADGKAQDHLNQQNYYIDEDRIVLEKYTQTFAIESDTLWIINQKEDQITRYIRVENLNGYEAQQK